MLRDARAEQRAGVGELPGVLSEFATLPGDMRGCGAGRLGLLLVGVLLLCSACGSAAAATPSGPETPPPGAASMTVQQTALALAKGNDDAGAWSLLEHLHMGVYTTRGQRILAGSETGPHDVFLYDFAVPALTRMARQPSRPFSAVVTGWSRMGIKRSAPELLSAYRAAYAAHPDAFLVQLLGALGAHLDGDPQLTPLAQWLLFLDAFLPPNGGVPSPVSPTVHGDVLLLASSGCDVRGDGSSSGWGMTLIPGSDLPLHPAYEALVGQLLAAGTSIQVHAAPHSVKQGVHGPGDSLQLTARVFVTLSPPPYPISCGVLAGLAVQPLAGPAQDVPVTWSWNPDVEHHGDFTSDGSPYAGQMTPTDAVGEAHLSFTAAEDPGEGQGPQDQAEGIVSVTADLRPLLLSHGYPAELAAWVSETSIPEIFDVVYHGTDLKVDWSSDGWHISGVKCGGPEGAWSLTVTASVSSDGVVMTANGTMTVTLGADGHGPLVGGMSLHVQGGESSADMKTSWSGTGTYTAGSSGGTLQVQVASSGQGTLQAPGFSEAFGGTGGGGKGFAVTAGHFC